MFKTTEMTRDDTTCRDASNMFNRRVRGLRPNFAFAGSDMSHHRILLLIFILCVAIAVPATDVAAEDIDSSAANRDLSAVVVGEPVSVSAFPVAVHLSGNRSRQRIVLTGTYSGDEVRDLTRHAEFTVADPAIVAVENGVVFPRANGETTIKLLVTDRETTVKVSVSDFEQLSDVSFGNEVLAALTRASCNMGACHGSPSGKGGFRLSLRGYDPALDIMTLRTEYFGRRTNILEPEESLVLKKPLMEIAHGGGRRLSTTDEAYTVLRNWIAEGMKLDPPELPRVVKLEVYPPSRVLQEDCGSQQLVALGHFSDGTVRDLTTLTVFSSSNESVAAVSADGLVTKVGRGETAILARYLDKMTTSQLTFLSNVEGFVWQAPPESNFVDTLAFEKLRQLKILPSELAADEEFVRRVYLDVTGRLPKPEETAAFLGDTADDKRTRLIDHLLESPDYAEFWTLRWCDVLRANSKSLKTGGTYKFHRWMYSNVLNDVPMDATVRELLTATGSVYENPAANYWRASRDPQDATETTAQLFLGVRIQCAKCHNHPFEKWTQDNYYGLAAAFVRVGRKEAPSPEDEVIYVKRSGDVTQPTTGEIMKVHLLLQGDVDVPDSQDRRQVFADWLTAPENPFFAKSIVNRVWGHVMGRGIVEPVDDFRDSNPPSNAALLDALAQGFVENHYSVKWVLRTILTSNTYQLSSQANRFNTEDDRYFSHSQTRLLTAEQLLDAISEVTGVEERFPGMPAGSRAVELVEPPANHYFLKVFGQPQREMACECERSDESNLSQALQMINGPVVHNKLRDERGRIAKMMADGKSDDDIITTLYLAALSREPKPEEMLASRSHIAAGNDRRQALEDIAWAVLNSKEFMFQH